jgi:tetratricopeptide (TPR) repeat protein
MGAFGWVSFAHTLDFKNSLTLNEYDAATSPHDPRRYNDIERMSIPPLLRREMNSVRSDSLHQPSRDTALTKEDLWRIIEDLQGELKYQQNDPEILHALAVASFARGFFLSSEKKFLAAERNKPHDATIPYNLGILYYSAHAGSAAESAWQNALRLDPTMGSAHLNLSFYYYETGQFPPAWEHCQKAVQLGLVVPSTLISELRRRVP